MPLKKWKTLSRKEVLKHPRMHLVEDEVRLPNGITTKYLRQAPVGSHSIIVIALNVTGEVLLQQEYSYPPDEIMWQLPGGSIEEGEDSIEAAKRELHEESNVMAQHCQVIGHYFTHNRRSDQKQYVVVATGIEQSKGQADVEEFIESTWMSIDELRGKIGKGEIHNSNTLAALNIWFNAEER